MFACIPFSHLGPDMGSLLWPPDASPGMYQKGGGGAWLGHSLGPPMVPAEGGPKNFKLKSSWHRSKILAVSLKHWKGRRGGRGVYGGGVPCNPLFLRCTAVLIHPCIPPPSAQLPPFSHKPHSATTVRNAIVSHRVPLSDGTGLARPGALPSPPPALPLRPHKQHTGPCSCRSCLRLSRSASLFTMSPDALVRVSPALVAPDGADAGGAAG